MSQAPLPHQHYNALEQAAYQLSSCTDELFRQIDQQKALNHVIDKIRSSLNLETILTTTTTEVRQLLNADRVGVFYFYPTRDHNEGELVAEDVAPGYPSVMAANVHGHGFGSQLAPYAEGQIHAVADIYTAGLSDCHIEVLAQFQVRANLVVPVIKGGALWGGICIHQCNQPRRWQLAEIEFVQKIAAYFAVALQQADQLCQITEAQEKALIRQKALVKISNRIRQSLEWQEICQTATDEVRQLLEVDRVAIYRFNADWSGDFVFESVAEGWNPLVGVSPCVEDTHLMETQGGRYATHETFAVADIYTAGHTDCHVELLEQFQARAYAIAPIFQNDRLWGLLAAYQNSGPRPWPADEVELLAQIGEQLGVVLQQVKQQQAAIDRQKALVKIVSKIRQSFDLADICNITTAEVRRILAVDRVAVYQFNADWSGDFVFESVAEGWNPLVGVSPCVEDTHLMETQGGRYAVHKTFATADIYTAGHTDCHVKLLEQFQARAYAIAPIFHGDRLWGLLAAYQNSGPRPWQLYEVELLAQVGEQLGIALQQTEFVQQIQAQSVELKQTLEKLQSSQLQLIQQEKMMSLGQLVAGVAHEINNPVNFIHGNLSHIQDYAQALLKAVEFYQNDANPSAPEIQQELKKLDIPFIQEDLPKTLNSMKLGTERIQEIVLSLRKFSRVDESEFKAVDIHEGLDSTLLILQHRLKAHDNRPKIEVIREYQDLPPVECYAGQLNQVFMNILANAIDALEEVAASKTYQEIQQNPGQIKIQTLLTDSNWLSITISDNGTGMPESICQQIFNPFFTTKPVGKGVGLGMSISYQIITEKHGGRLDCISTPGEYTAFRIEIPVRQNPI